MFYYFDTNVIKDFFLKKIASHIQITSLLANVYNIEQKDVEKNKISPVIEIADVNKIMAKHVYTVLLVYFSFFV